MVREGVNNKRTFFADMSTNGGGGQSKLKHKISYFILIFIQTIGLKKVHILKGVRKKQS